LVRRTKKKKKAEEKVGRKGVQLEHVRITTRLFEGQLGGKVDRGGGRLKRGGGK